ncbi:GNAT family N-acetyltransferase [Brucella sp. IR073]|uniref:GNAT family N-acetyltransferase n=1 Tax=unclassified Brucella TaxID=2632610 RepID=UPI003B9808F4
MVLRIEPLDRYNLKHVGQVDGAFIVDAELALSFEAGSFHHKLIPVTPYTKRYEEPETLSDYLDAPDSAGFIAYLDGRPAGYVLIRENWNRFALIEDIAVDANCRRHGVGRALLEKAGSWAGARKLPGLMLETQSNNVAACRLYEACGFVLGGFDRFLYTGENPKRTEIALFWYRRLEAVR